MESLRSRPPLVDSVRTLGAGGGTIAWVGGVIVLLVMALVPLLENIVDADGSTVKWFR